MYAQDTNVSHLSYFINYITKLYICLGKPLALLVVLFYLKQNQFALNACADYLVFVSTIFYLTDTIHFIQYHTETLSVFSRGRT